MCRRASNWDAVQMATFFDAMGFLQNFGIFSVVIPFILVAALVFGVLEKLQLFGENKTSIHIIIAVAMGLIVASLSKVSLFISNVMPLLAGFVVLLVFFLVILLFVGVPQEEILRIIKTEPAAWGSIVVVFAIIIFAALSQTMPESACIWQPDLPGCEEWLATHNTIFDIVGMQTTKALTNPTVLGVLIILVLLGGATYMITRQPKK